MPNRSLKAAFCVLLKLVSFLPKEQLKLEKEKLRIQEMEIKEREMQLKRTLELTKANLSKFNSKPETSAGNSSSNSPGSAKSAPQETVRKEDLSAYVQLVA